MPDHYSQTPRRDSNPPSYHYASPGEREPLFQQDGSDNGQKIYDFYGNAQKFGYPAVIFFLAVAIVAILQIRPCVYEVHKRQWEQDEKFYQEQRAAHLVERQKWLAEKAEIDQWEASLERKREDIFWDDYKDLGCFVYGKRHHSATLSNVAAGLIPKTECERKPMYIFDQWIVPSRCEDPRTCGNMIGNWEVESHLCKPSILEYQDHGCIEPGKRLYKGKLDDVRDWVNWEQVCMTMPGYYKGIDMKTPFKCSPCNNGKCGYWAEWRVDDHLCWKL